MADAELLLRYKNRLKMCFTVLNHYNWLLDSYILDFFTDDHMGKLPSSWQEFLKVVPLEDFHQLLNFSGNQQTVVYPLSIACLKSLLQYLVLSRKVNKTNPYQINSNKLDVSHSGNGAGIEVDTVVPLEYPQVWNLFLKHVKCKKRYEIFRMGQLTAEIARKLNVHCVVDVGSGVGHLSRVMSFGFNLRVCSLESEPHLTEQARKFDSEFEATGRKHLNDAEFKFFKERKPIHINRRIRCDMDVPEFLEDVKAAFPGFGDSAELKFGIVGLHPCGDLATVLLKLYSRIPEAKFINLAGCCYHKLTTFSDSSSSNTGYPLTSFCAESGTDISYEARSLACHAIETYQNRLRSKDYAHLRVHCYRAALEDIINRNWPRYRKMGLSNVKAGTGSDFGQYCRMAMRKLDVTVSETDLESRETKQNLNEWQNVVKYYSLRLMLAPLVETVILLDRTMYLLERGIPCRILAAFEPEISPRNQLLISEKPV